MPPIHTRLELDPIRISSSRVSLGFRVSAIAGLSFGRSRVAVMYAGLKRCSILTRLGSFENALMFRDIRQPDRTASGRTRRSLFSALSCALLFLFGFASASAANEQTRSAAAAPASSGQQLAISDFDGDLNPDLASVQAGLTTSGSTDYWIQLQLSAAGRQSIRLVAPAGGLLIEARDVNGDHAVDLILTTSFREPVAVFLNDGHGSFSRVAPSVFPGVFSNPRTNWASALDQGAEAVGVPPQSRPGILQAAKLLTNIRPRADSIFRAGAGFAVDFFLVSHAGRAPPA